jgi:hypothetical protein
MQWYSCHIISFPSFLSTLTLLLLLLPYYYYNSEIIKKSNMGITFRSGGYIKHVWFRGRTIKDGEAAAIWDAKGIHTQIVGPKRVWLFNSTIRFLTRHKAKSHQYLIVSHRDGRVEHIIGPAIMYENPAYHDKISVQDGYRLCSDSECIVTFSSVSTGTNMNTGKSIGKIRSDQIGDEMEQADFSSSSPLSPENVVSKRIIRGPTLFIPKPSEHVHTFSWSSTNIDLTSSTSSTSQNSNSDYDNNDDGNDHVKTKFNILQSSGTSSPKITIPTVDGFSLDVSLIISYKIKSIDKIIQNQDPIQYLYNSLLSDSQTLGDSFPSEVLKMRKESVISTLSNIRTYPSLINAGNNCGLDIDSIQVTTVSLCTTLLEQIDKEQSLSANIRYEVAKKSSSQKIREMEVEEERKRVEEEASLKRMQIITNDKLDLESHVLKLAALERKSNLEKYEAEVIRDVEKVKEEPILEFLIQLKNMGVDMTKFMTTYGGLEIADKVIGKSDVVKMDPFSTLLKR